MATEIPELTTRIMGLGRKVETALRQAIEALIRRDTLLARAIVEGDAEIDRAEIAVQEHCLRILEKERPTGGDLRYVVAVLKINDGLERIGDLAENVAKVVVEVGAWDRFKRVGGCKELAAKCQELLATSLQALVQRDAALARRVVNEDDEVDRRQERIRVRIEHEIDVCPENASPLLKLEYITRQFERVGDLATNIAEEVIYLVEGKIVRHEKRLSGSSETLGFHQVL
ncbi:MAG: phosphate signaling complex protein PhoU [Pirellulales bacterium]